MRRILGLLLMVSVLLPAPSIANTKRTQDDAAHDAASTPFDIKWVKHGHAGRKLAHTISTYEGWRSSKLGDNGKFQINIAPGKAGVTRIIVIYLDGGELVSKMYNVFDGSETVGRPQVRRPTSRTVRVTFPKRWLKRGLEAYRYDVLYAEQMTEDTVPNDEGSILHRM